MLQLFWIARGGIGVDHYVEVLGTGFGAAKVSRVRSQCHFQTGDIAREMLQKESSVFST